MIKAVIDLGTNTFKCVIASMDGVRPEILRDFSIGVRLGEGLAREGIITPEAQTRALEALDTILAECGELHAGNICCVGAMTLRSATNAEDFMALVKSRTGLSIRVLGGDAEASLAWKAATDGVDTVRTDTLVLDIGGGSTELVRGSGIPAMAHSMPIGALTISSRYLHGNPPADSEVLSARQHVQSLIPRDILHGFSGQVIACGGTVTNFASMHLHLTSFQAELIDATSMTVDEVDALLDRLERMTLDHLRQMPGLQPQRAGIITGGGIILSTLLNALSVQDFTVSTRGIRHALLLETEDATP